MGPTLTRHLTKIAEEERARKDYSFALGDVRKNRLEELSERGYLADRGTHPVMGLRGGGLGAAIGGGVGAGGGLAGGGGWRGRLGGALGGALLGGGTGAGIGAMIRHQKNKNTKKARHYVEAVKSKASSVDDLILERAAEIIDAYGLEKTASGDDELDVLALQMLEDEGFDLSPILDDE